MSTQSFSPSMPIATSAFSDQHEHVRVQQVEQLYGQAPIGIIASLVNAFILAFVQWNVVSNPHIMVWVGCVLTVNIVGGLLVYEYHQTQKTGAQAKIWSARFFARSVASGLVWGAFPVFLYPHDSIPHQIFLALIIGGKVAGATAVHAASKEVFLAFSVCSITPLLARFLFDGSQFHLAMGIAGMLFLGMMIMTMRRNHGVLMNAIRLHLENSSLITHLSEERDKAKVLNRTLSEEVNACQVMERELIQHRDHLEQLVENRTYSLRISEARFQFLAENISDVIWVMTLDGARFSYMSSSVERVLGYSRDEALRLSLKDLLTPEALDTARMMIGEEMAIERQGTANPSRYRTLELEHRRKDGSVIVAEIQASFIRNEQGVAIGFVGVSRDVTERKNIEETRRRMDTQLLRSQKMESIGTLAGGIAHDFNNLLTGVMGNISLAKNFLSEQSSELRFLRMAESESLRAKELSQQLLAFAKGGDPITQVTSLEGLVRNTVEFSLSGSAIAREYVYDEPLRFVEVDVGQMGQVIQSIVMNTVESLSHDGRLIVQWENLGLTESSPSLAVPVPSGPYVKVSFSDNGSGIRPDDLAKVFDPYFTTKPDHYGLGLTSAYTIMSKHQGYLTVESTVGVGTCVSLYVPACAEEATVVPSAPIGKKNGSGKVLVMDDEESIRVLASEMLRACGYHFEMAKNGEEALTLYQQAKETDTPFSAVILDLTVPGGLGGKETMVQLLQIDPNVKAVVSSGYSNDPIMAQYQRFGFHAVMTKPYSLTELSDVMYQLVMESPHQ
ncbi:hybrid sensor histidine kinase/response regulator [Nitrospira sp. M1]